MAVTNEERRLYSLINGDNADAPVIVRASDGLNQSLSNAAQPSARVLPQTIATADGNALHIAEHTAQQADYGTTADAKLDETINQYLNQNGYRYDINNDDAYREFAREHSQGAERGRNLSVQGARALANGYEPTYADAVANEVYNDQAARTGEYAPQFERLAAQEAAAKQQSSGNLMSLYGNMAQREYGRQRDEQGDRMNFLNYLANRYRGERELEAQKDAADASIYNTRLSALSDDLTAARKADAQRMEYVTQSADNRAKIAEDIYENNRKLAYNREKDAYDRSNDETKLRLQRQKEEEAAAARLAAQQAKAEASAVKQAKTKIENQKKAAAKEQANAKKAARQHKINAREIAKFMSDGSDYSKLSATHHVDWDYNDDGKIDSRDLTLANDAVTENDIKSGKGLKIEKGIENNPNVKETIQTIREMHRESRYKKMPVSQLAKMVIERNEKLTYPETGWLYEFYGLG